MNEYAQAAINFNYWRSIWQFREIMGGDDIHHKAYGPNVNMAECLSAISNLLCKRGFIKITRGVVFSGRIFDRSGKVNIVAYFAPEWQRKVSNAIALLNKDPNLPSEFEPIKDILTSTHTATTIFSGKIIERSQIVNVKVVEAEFAGMLANLEKACQFVELLYSKWSASEIRAAFNAEKFPNVKNPRWTSDGFKCDAIRLVSYRRSK